MTVNVAKDKSQEIHVTLESRFGQRVCVETSVCLKAHFLIPYENERMFSIAKFV